MADDVFDRLRASDPAATLKPLSSASLEALAPRARGDGDALRALPSQHQRWLPIAGSGIAAALIMSSGAVLFATAQEVLPAVAVRPPVTSATSLLPSAAATQGDRQGDTHFGAVVSTTSGLYRVRAPIGSLESMSRVQELLAQHSADPSTKVSAHLDHGVTFWTYLTAEGSPCVVDVSLSTPAGTCAPPWTISRGVDRAPSATMAAIVRPNLLWKNVVISSSRALLERATASIEGKNSAVIWSIERNTHGQVIAASGVLGAVIETARATSETKSGDTSVPRFVYGCQGNEAVLFLTSTVSIPRCK